MLDVFGAEVDGCGLEEVEELGADGGDAGEEGGAGAAFEGGGEGGWRGDGEAGGLGWGLGAGGWVHCLGAGGKEEGDAATAAVGEGEFFVQGFELFQVFFPGSRICREVFFRAELCRVDEDGDKDVGVLSRGGANEGEVAGMEGAHGGDEADGLGLRKELGSICPEGGDVVVVDTEGVGVGMRVVRGARRCVGSSFADGGEAAFEDMLS